MSEDYFTGKTCNECAWLTEKFPIRSRDLTEKDLGLCRMYILHDTFAIMHKAEKACPEFIPKK